MNIQVNVTGWKQVQNGTMNSSTGTWRLYYNGNGLCHLTVLGQAAIQGTGRDTSMFSFDSKYAPIESPIVRHINSKSNLQFQLIPHCTG